ncbi:trichohyalin-like isoform X2 [Ruditapes philippinarum]|uniref:trichohyalin-like isoform X2 n=1 Tax=Ruditapes philippinarum TaxID=129788 RepID=UPI00295B8EBA|nr:trichohyalin-like isoform X2 [Ruditapes philippinarum]
MMHNRAPRGPQVGGGSGLLGEGPGMKRMMPGIGGGGLLGKAPTENRMHQPRSLLERADLAGGMRKQPNMRGGLLDQPNLRDRQGYNQGGRLEQQADIGYYNEAGGDYMENLGAYSQEYEDPNAGAYDQGGDVRYESQDDGYGYSYNNEPARDLYQAQANTQRGLLQDPSGRGQELDYGFEERGFRHEEQGMRHQEPTQRQRQTGGYEVRGLLEVPAEPRGLLRNADEQRGMMNQPRDQQGRPSSRHQHGLLDQQREHGFIDSVHDRRGLMEIPGLDLHTEQQGLLDYPRDQQRGLMDPPSIIDIPEPPRPPRSLMDSRKEPRSLMDTPMEPRGLMDIGRDQKNFMEKPMVQQRGNRGQQQRGLLDTPREKRAQLSPNPQNTMNRPRTKQSELMEKADLQMKLLQQEKMREMEQMEQLNLLKQQQQALLLQQQQQHMQQIQQQEFEQQLQIKQQMQQAEIIMNATKGQQRNSGAIPSLFDVPTRGKTTLGKRPSAPIRNSDNKRARPGDRQNRRPLVQGRKDSSSRDRLGGRRNDRNDRNNRNRRGSLQKRKSSPDRKSRDRRVSGSRDGSSKKSTPSRDKNDRNDRGKDRKNEKGKDKVEKEDTNKEKPKTEITVTMGEKYDPAEPTEDITEEEEVAKADSVAVEKMETDEKDDSKDVEIKEENKEEDQKPKEISLTVTVNKKGRSVNDADQDESKKIPREKMYKCNICSVSCYDEASFSRHMGGKKHGDKMKIVMSSTSHQTELIKSRLQAEEHLRQIESKKRTPVKQGPVGAPGPKGKALETLCKVCEKNFTGAYKDHKESPDHKAKEDRSKAGCKICNVSTFSTYDGFKKHLQSVWHLKNRKKLNSEDDDEEMSELVTLDTVGFDDDSVNAEKKEKEMETDTTFAKPLAVSTPIPKPTEKPVKAKPEVPTLSKIEEDIEIPDTYDPNLALGQRYVVPVSGFFCKLCHKFYNNEAAAKVAHCQSETHFERLKKAVAAKRLKAKKEDVSQPQSGDKESGTSQSNEMKNGDQTGDETANMEDQSVDETADVNENSVNEGSQDTSDNSQDEGESTLEDSESKDKGSDTASPVVAVKRPTARRGGYAARARRGRK